MTGERGGSRKRENISELGSVESEPERERDSGSSGSDTDLGEEFQLSILTNAESNEPEPSPPRDITNNFLNRMLDRDELTFICARIKLDELKWENDNTADVSWLLSDDGVQQEVTPNHPSLFQIHTSHVILDVVCPVANFCNDRISRTITWSLNNQGGVVDIHIIALGFSERLLERILNRLSTDFLGEAFRVYVDSILNPYQSTPNELQTIGNSIANLQNEAHLYGIQIDVNTINIGAFHQAGCFDSIRRVCPVRFVIVDPICLCFPDFIFPTFKTTLQTLEPTLVFCVDTISWRDLVLDNVEHDRRIQLDLYVTTINALYHQFRLANEMPEHFGHLLTPDHFTEDWEDFCQRILLYPSILSFLRISNFQLDFFDFFDEMQPVRVPFHNILNPEHFIPRFTVIDELAFMQSFRFDDIPLVTFSAYKFPPPTPPNEQ